MNLTPFGILALVAAALLGIVGTWSVSLGTFPWWRLVVASLVVGLTVEFLVVRRSSIAARWLAAERLFLGRAATLALELRNGSARPVTLRALPLAPDAIVRTDEPAVADPFDRGRPGGNDRNDGEERSIGISGVRTLHVPPLAGGVTDVRVRALELGAHRWPVLPIRVLGPLGLAWWSRKTDPGTTSVVLPDTLGRRAIVTGSAEAGLASRAKLGGGHELHQLREYRPGDPRNTIDWKASARSSQLITRVYSEDQHLEIMILLDAGRTSRTEVDGMSQLGHYVNLAARFAEYCAHGDDRVGLVAFADRPLRVVPPGRGAPGLTRIRRALADLAPQPVESDALEAALHVRRLVRHRCLAVVLTDLYESSATGRLARTAMLLAQKHLPMMVGLLGAEVAAMTGLDASDWLDPYRSLAARSYERQVTANVARLAELGALAMTARPHELDGKVLEQYRRLRSQHRI